MAQIGAGSLDAWGELYDRYCNRAYRVARAVAVDGAHAEEAVQEAFIAIWNSRATYRPQQATAAPWLLTVVHHRAIDVVRRAARHEEHQTDDGSLEARRSGVDVAQEAVDHEQARRLRMLLAGLPSAQREVIILAFYGQLTHTEIAEQLELPIGTVKGRMRLGLDKLRGEIAQISS